MTDGTLQALRLHLVGCGNMGGALLKSWLEAGVKPQNVSVRVATDASAARLRDAYGVNASTTCRYDNEDIVIWGVKPQMLDDVIAADWADAPQQPLYISIAAGKTLDYFGRKLGSNARIIRTMPNTPSMVGKGVTTMVAGSHATETDKQRCEALFKASGMALWLADEDALNTAAAIAGSGPAYVFHFAECLMQAGQELGLDADTTRALVQGTLGGSVALADAEGWHDMAKLRQNVTSKGGVTQAALEVLMPQMPDLILKALKANIRRSQELS